MALPLMKPAYLLAPTKEKKKLNRMSDEIHLASENGKLRKRLAFTFDPSVWINGYGLEERQVQMAFPSEELRERADTKSASDVCLMRA